MPRKLFCEISPLTYQISVGKEIFLRRCRDALSREHFARKRSEEFLPAVVCQHKSLIRRKLGNVRMDLQENKAVNLALAAPKVTKILIRPGETFSFWHLVGRPTARKGYLEGLTIAGGRESSGLAGGMCQFTNLIHWMVLHSALTITEHHHHDGVDLFPDYHRQIPFGTGTSIVYNYLDYRFQNHTERTYQLIVYTTEEYLCGELRTDQPEPYRYHIRLKEEHFSREGDSVYRNGRVIRETIDARTGDHLNQEVIRINHAKVMYDTDQIKLS